MKLKKREDHSVMASELIKQLQRVIKKHGDCEVWQFGEYPSTFSFITHSTERDYHGIWEKPIAYLG